MHVRLSPRVEPLLPTLGEARTSVPLPPDTERDIEGWALIRLRFDHPESAIRHLLGLGTGVEVVAPSDLRQRMAAEITRMKTVYADSRCGGHEPAPALGALMSYGIRARVVNIESLEGFFGSGNESSFNRVAGWLKNVFPHLDAELPDAPPAYELLRALVMDPDYRNTQGGWRPQHAAKAIHLLELITGWFGDPDLQLTRSGCCHARHPQ